MSIPARMINDGFQTKLATSEGRDKMAEYGGTFVRDRLREVNFSGKIIPQVPVVKADCQRSVRHDTLVKIVDIEPKSRAMTMTFRGQPTARLIRADRVEVAFATVASELVQKTEQELMAYEMPVTKIIEENSVKDMDEILDREFVFHAEASVQALQTEANGGTATALNYTNINLGAVVEFSVFKGELARTLGSNTAVVQPLQRPDVVNLIKRLDGNRLRAERLLLTEPDFDDVLQWTVEDNGDRIQSETTVDGYKYNLLVGRAYVRTIKTDILRPGNVYCFTKPEFLGRNYVLNNTKFYIDKIANNIMFQAWMDVGMCIANVASVKKLELYSADACTTDADGLRASFIPVAEDALGAENHRQGVKFPSVTSY